MLELLGMVATLDLLGFGRRSMDLSGLQKRALGGS